MSKLNYNVPRMTLDELATARFALKQTLCLWWKWRASAFWRGNIRDIVSALKKLKQAKVDFSPWPNI